MAKTLSTMSLELGETMPEFHLADLTGDIYDSKNLKNIKGFLVAFICNHCPYVVHIRESFVAVSKKLQSKGIEVVAINSNDSDMYPEDSPEKMKEYADRFHYSFPYLYDETQNVAKAFDAACTPDFYLFDQSKKLYYRGEFDSSRPGNQVPCDGETLMQAANDMLAQAAPPANQRPSLGCNIKWKAT